LTYNRIARWALLVVPIAICAWLIASAPGTILDKAHRAGYAVCHQIPSHSFAIDGQTMPLCARCSGSYLAAGMTIMLLVLIGRIRYAAFPRKAMIVLAALFVLGWAGDGFNSYLTLFPGVPSFYVPTNTGRVITGALEGTVLGIALVLLFNRAVWVRPVELPIIGSWRQAGLLMVGVAALVVAIESDWDVLLVPLAVISAGMVVLLLGGLNGLLLVVATRHDGRYERWRELVAPMAWGTALALAELGAIGAGRAFVTRAWGLPF
jgi:uncharacterized membrane protein